VNRRLWVAPVLGLLAAAYLVWTLPGFSLAALQCAGLTGLLVAGTVEVGRRWAGRSS